MNCQICNMHEAEWKDYRFINSCGLQGKVYSCNWCRDLDDVAVSRIKRHDIDPRNFYDDEELETMNAMRKNRKANSE